MAYGAAQAAVPHYARSSEGSRIGRTQPCWGWQRQQGRQRQEGGPGVQGGSLCAPIEKQAASLPAVAQFSIPWRLVVPGGMVSRATGLTRWLTTSGSWGYSLSTNLSRLPTVKLLLPLMQEMQQYWQGMLDRVDKATARKLIPFLDLTHVRASLPPSCCSCDCGAAIWLWWHQSCCCCPRVLPVPVSMGAATAVAAMRASVVSPALLWKSWEGCLA